MEQGYDKTMGARPLRRVIESEIRDNVTDFYLDHIDAKHLLADVKDGHIVISEKQIPMIAKTKIRLRNK